jgi:hypothetical protein
LAGGKVTEDGATKQGERKKEKQNKKGIPIISSRAPQVHCRSGKRKFDEFLCNSYA